MQVSVAARRTHSTLSKVLVPVPLSSLSSQFTAITELIWAQTSDAAPFLSIALGARRGEGGVRGGTEG